MHYPHFMEVTTQKANKKVLINIDNIAVITPLQEGYDYRRIYTNDGDYTDVTESYDEIISLMVEAGTCFVKKDPRIDYHPITWAELKEMVGEPVWGENQQKWFLVAQYDEESKEITLRGATMELYKSAVTYTEQMLIAKPLYRIKVFS